MVEMRIDSSAREVAVADEALPRTAMGATSEVVEPECTTCAGAIFYG